MKNLKLSQFLIPGLMILIFTECSKDDFCGPSPCIYNEIEIIEMHPQCDNSQVAEYKFQGKSVFVFDLGNCVDDGGSKVLDIYCNEIGFLGGFVGNQDVNGVEFYKKAKFIRTLWKN